MKVSLSHYLNRVLEGQRKPKNRNRNGGVRENVPELKDSLRWGGFRNYLMKETERSQNRGALEDSGGREDTESFQRERERVRTNSLPTVDRAWLHRS